MLKARQKRNAFDAPAERPGVSDPDSTLRLLQDKLESEEGADRIASLRTIGDTLIGKRRYNEALPVFESLLALEPTNAQTLETLARCLERLGRFGQAAARYRVLLEVDPDRPEALAGLGLCLLRQDEPQAALVSFDRCLRLKPFHVGALLGKAMCLRLAGKAAEAEEIYREAARVKPEIAKAVDELIGQTAGLPALEQLGAASDLGEVENVIAAAVSAEDYATAAEYCRTLTGLAPDYYEAWFNLGVFEARNGNSEAAAHAFRSAARQRPSAVEPLQALAHAEYLRGDLEAAETHYQAALALAPDAHALIWNVGLVLEQRGDMRGAEQAYSRLVKLDQDRGEAWFRLGLARLHLDEGEGAVVAFRRALDLGTRTLESNYNLGLAYWNLGRVGHAAEGFRACLRIQAGFAPARRGLAAVALREAEYSRAADLHRELLERGDASAEIVFNLAVFEHRANRLNSAIEFYKQALKIDPDLADASAGLALAKGMLSARRFK